MDETSSAAPRVIRPGHHRPLGTTTTMRFRDWPRDSAPPELGDFIAQTVTAGSDPDELERAYEVVGVGETRTGYRLICERIDYERFRDRVFAHAGYGEPIPEPEHLLNGRLDDRWVGFWTFWNLPRR